MKVQAPKKPGLDRAVPVEAKGYLGLMYCPGIFHLIRVFTGQRKIGLPHTMRELEYDAERHAHHDHNYGIEEEHNPKRVIEQGKPEGQYEKNCFANNEYEKIPPLWTGYAVPVDPAGDQVPKIGYQLPFHDQ